MLLHEPFELIDLTGFSDDELSQHGYVAAMELLQKHIYKPDILPTVHKVIREGAATAIRATRRWWLCAEVGNIRFSKRPSKFKG